MVRNVALETMRAGKVALGITLRFERGTHIARAMQVSGFDWLFLDLEHGAIPLDTVAAISMAGLEAGITPIVRVPAMDVGMAVRVLDTGALGVLMPHVETVEEARAIAAAFRYPPLGHRSISSTLPHFHFKPPPLLEACRQLDAATMVGVMLETPSAVENVDEIAAVPGIDVLLIGASDLTAESGLHGQFEHPRVLAMFEKVMAAGRRHGKVVGIGGIGSDADMARCCGMGMKMIVAAGDISLLVSAASARTRSLRELIAGSPAERQPG